MGNLIKETPFSEITATLEVLSRHGIGREQLALFRTNDNVAKEVADLLCRGDTNINNSSEVKAPRAIIDKNFFGIEEWQNFYKVKFTKEQLRQAAIFPWSEDILNSVCPFCGKVVKECHFAFLGLDKTNGDPLTIMKWQELHNVSDQPRFYEYAPYVWYADETFAKNIIGDFRWYLLHKEAIPTSAVTTAKAHMAMIVDYEFPLAIIEVVKDILYYWKNSLYLNQKMYALCSDIISLDRHVKVGNFSSDGLNIQCHDSKVADDLIGLAASRKLPSLKL